MVSVVIPVLNSEKDVEPCLAALKKQNYPQDRLEIIIVDNGSTDGTQECLRKAGLRWYSRDKRGRSCALNTGVEHAVGEIICTTDISCIAEPNWIANIVNTFNDSDVGCVAGEIKQLERKVNRIVKFQQRVNYMSPMVARKRKRLPFLPYADGANASFRHDVFKQIGLFDEDFIKAADVEICYRLWVKTHYKVEFNENAVVWEEGEPSLRALLKQRYRIGIGQVLMRWKYGEIFETARQPLSIRSLYWSIRARILKLVRSIGWVFSAGWNSDNRVQLYDAWIKWLMSTSQVLGRLVGPFILKRKGVQLVPIDSDSLKRFANSWPNDTRLLR